MGDWTVRLVWNHLDGFHKCYASNPRSAASVLRFQCFPAIEEHQFEGPEVPEFTISVKWQEGDLDKYLDGKQSHAHGWRYVMRWVDTTGETKVVSAYGFPTEQRARDEAETKATKIVKAQQPEKVYRFTPEV